MPIIKYPFKKIGEGAHHRPYLPLQISSPTSGRIYYTYGLIDTGATECVISQDALDVLGINIMSGSPIETIGVGGPITGYRHTLEMEIWGFDEQSGEIDALNIIHKIYPAPFICIPKLRHVLLGVNDFLLYNTLSINYPEKHFSVINHNN